MTSETLPQLNTLRACYMHVSVLALLFRSSPLKPYKTALAMLLISLGALLEMQKLILYLLSLQLHMYLLVKRTTKQGHEVGQAIRHDYCNISQIVNATRVDKIKILK